MLRLLIDRPIALLTCAVSAMVLGGIAVWKLPVSFLPEVSLARQMIRISIPGASAREIEDAVTRPLRNQMLQCHGLSDVFSQSQNGAAGITLEFDYQVDADLALIETNEKIDQLMPQLPPNIRRPEVINISAAEIPIFYLSLRDKRERAQSGLDISQLSISMFRRQLEQLQEVAFADISGFQKPQIVIEPDQSAFQALSISEQDIATCLSDNNLEPENISINEGYYQYNLRLQTRLHSVEDIRNIYLNTGGRVLQLKDVAKVTYLPQKRRGFYLFNGQEAIVIAVYKQSEADLFKLQDKIIRLVREWQTKYPNIDFNISNDQSQLLKVSINSLNDNLFYGILFIVAALWLLFRDWRTTLWISLSIPLAMLVTMLGLYTLGLSINIMSLAGLILGTGMMIDNSVVILEHIRVKRQEGLSLREASLRGAGEILAPMLSSTLTTCCVFFPLVLLGGLSGALFFDQAAAVSIALSASVLVAYLLVPTLLYQFPGKERQAAPIAIDNNLGVQNSWFVRSVDWSLYHPKLILSFAIASIIVSGWLLRALPLSLFPKLPESQAMVQIDWNEPLSLDENIRRTKLLLHFLGPENMLQSSALIGEQQFILSTDQQSMTKVQLDLALQNKVSIRRIEEKIKIWMRDTFPSASYNIKPSYNIFNNIFSNETAPLVVSLRVAGEAGIPSQSIADQLYKWLDVERIAHVKQPVDEEIEIHTDVRKALLYHVEPNQVNQHLQSLFQMNELTQISLAQTLVPVQISILDTFSLSKKINNAFIRNKDGQLVPLRFFVDFAPAKAYRIISGDQGGEALIVPLTEVRNPQETMVKMDHWARQNGLNLRFTGQFFKNKENIKELAGIFGVAGVLLFLILAAQFESLILPFIVIVAVPVSLLGALLPIYITGNTLNIMTFIGLIVMSGIVVNDSILKLDIIKSFARSMSLRDAIHLGGRVRLRPILITSLPTVLALVPEFFSGSFAAALQRPLGIAVIGGLALGTVVSLYLTPVLCSLIIRQKEQVC